MLKIEKNDILESLKSDNLWWSQPERPVRYSELPRRAYLPKLYNLVTQTRFVRAVVVMGPRRVGKTVMLYQCIDELVQQGVPQKNILYVSMQTPTYADLSPEDLFRFFLENNALTAEDNTYVFLDEIQYFKNWEVHLKTLVDRFPACKFTVSGSAAAALRLQSIESGAGRFSDFMLPPLTFAEYLHFKKLETHLIISDPPYYKKDRVIDIQALNDAFVDYINFGGFPEVVFSGSGNWGDYERFIRSDIIDKVLQKDLPQLYGIGDIRDLNRLFTVLAYNSGQEVKVSDFSDTEQKYLNYLEAAFLVSRVRRIDDNGKHYKRQHSFKVYLTNPSMRAALFRPIKPDDRAMGAMAETAIFSQWFHSPQFYKIRYARWQTGKGGEVDIVGMDEATQKPLWAYDVKWSDRFYERPQELVGLRHFAKKSCVEHLGATTKTVSGEKDLVDDRPVRFFPCSLHCYQIGKRLI